MVLGRCSRDKIGSLLFNWANWAVESVKWKTSTQAKSSSLGQRERAMTGAANRHKLIRLHSPAIVGVIHRCFRASMEINAHYSLAADNYNVSYHGAPCSSSAARMPIYSLLQTCFGRRRHGQIPFLHDSFLSVHGVATKPEGATRLLGSTTSPHRWAEPPSRPKRASGASSEPATFIDAHLRTIRSRGLGL